MAVGGERKENGKRERIKDGGKGDIYREKRKAKGMDWNNRKCERGRKRANRERERKGGGGS